MSSDTNNSYVLWQLSAQSRSLVSTLCPALPTGRANFVRISFLSRSRKLRAERECRSEVVLCQDRNCSFRVRHIIFLITICALICFCIAWRSICLWTFDFVRVSQNFSRLPYLKWRISNNESAGSADTGGCAELANPRTSQLIGLDLHINSLWSSAASPSLKHSGLWLSRRTTWNISEICFAGSRILVQRFHTLSICPTDSMGDR